MKRGLILLVSIFSIPLCIIAQQAEVVLLTIDGKPIYKSQFEETYRKEYLNNLNEKKESPKDFVQSYIDFRLNIEEAKAQQLDTTASYIREYYSYKTQLSNFYLKDTIIHNSLIEKLYSRMQKDVDINHILLPFGKQEIFPSDTLALYNKAKEIRNRLVNNGFTGDGFIDNPSNPSIVMDISSINGHLGWITAFMLPLPVEDAAYSLPLKEISMPIRTQKGYHLVQVVDRRKAVGGSEVEQVLFHFSNIPPAKHQIDSVGIVARRISEEVHATKDFDALCNQFATAYGTGQGCYFGVVKLDTKVSSSFVTAALDLKKTGDISQPVMTDYGFHLLRLVNRIEVPPLSAVKKWIGESMKSSDRSRLYINELRENLIKKYGYSLHQECFAELIQIAGKTDPENPGFAQQIADVNEVLFTVGGKKTYTVREFMDFVKAEAALKTEDPNVLPSIKIIENSTYNLSTDKLKDLLITYSYNKLYAYSESVLEENNFFFAEQMKNYSEGILYFDVKNKNVWDKAKKDTQGLSAYFEKNKSNYKWSEPRFKGLILHCKDEDFLKQAEDIYNQYRNESSDIIMSEIRSALNKDVANVLIETGTWVQGDNPNVDNKIYGENKPVESRRNFPNVTVVGKTISVPTDYTDVSSDVEFDYQKELERKWTETLRKKYKVIINKSVLKTI